MNFRIAISAALIVVVVGISAYEMFPFNYLVWGMYSVKTVIFAISVLACIGFIPFAILGFCYKPKGFGVAYWFQFCVFLALYVLLLRQISTQLNNM